MEPLQAVVPPLVRLRVGEVGIRGQAGPHLGKERPSGAWGGPRTCRLTFPRMTFPSQSLINTSLFIPSSYGQYEPSGCVLLMPGSCVWRRLSKESSAHTHAHTH